MSRQFWLKDPNLAPPENPQRIISLVPSQTELLHTLGLNLRVVGITKFCVHPNDWFRNKTRVGGTKKLSLDKIAALQPDLIIANKEENEKSQIEQAATIAPVLVTDIDTLDDATKMIEEVAALTGTAPKGRKLLEKIESGFRMLPPRSLIGKTAAYLIWKNPWMAAGGNTFIHDMLCRAGLINIFATENRYPEISLDELRRRAPDLILLSSEPYPFKTRHLSEFLEMMPQSKPLLVDGEMFSWYGSRLQYFPDYVTRWSSQINDPSH